MTVAIVCLPLFPPQIRQSRICSLHEPGQGTPSCFHLRELCDRA